MLKKLNFEFGLGVAIRISMSLCGQPLASEQLAEGITAGSAKQ
jgi:hypothetical protein